MKPFDTESDNKTPAIMLGIIAVAFAIKLFGKIALLVVFGLLVVSCAVAASRLKR